MGIELLNESGFTCNEDSLRSVIAFGIQEMGLHPDCDVEISLAEKAADKRASTPSNAAELLVPDKKQVMNQITHNQESLNKLITNYFARKKQDIFNITDALNNSLKLKLENIKFQLEYKDNLLKALSPLDILKRGYNIMSQNKRLIRSEKDILKGQKVSIQFYESSILASLENIEKKG